MIHLFVLSTVLLSIILLLTPYSDGVLPLLVFSPATNRYAMLLAKIPTTALTINY